MLRPDVFIYSFWQLSQFCNLWFFFCFLESFYFIYGIFVVVSFRRRYSCNFSFLLVLKVRQRTNQHLCVLSVFVLGLLGKGLNTLARSYCDSCVLFCMWHLCFLSWEHSLFSLSCWITTGCQWQYSFMQMLKLLNLCFLSLFSSLLSLSLLRTSFEGS